MKNNNVVYSIVIPVYKSGHWLEQIVSRIESVMASVVEQSYELILVDDSSPDTITWPTIEQMARKHYWVRGFRLLFNAGQFKATLCGIAKARGEYILNMDDDLQHYPEDIPILINAMLENPDALCIMGRYENKQHNIIRNLGSGFHQLITRAIYGTPKHIKTSSFRIMKRELAQAILTYRTAKPIIGPLIVSLTPKIQNVTVRHDVRNKGNSGYNLFTLFKTAVDNIVNTSTAPLRFFSAIGFVCAGTSILLSLFFLIRWSMGGIGVAGFTTQILLIIFFGGMTLVGIGVLGEYIARVITEITGPERYFIRNETEYANTNNKK